MTDLQLDGFEDFWRAYPLKRGKLAAMQAYAKALKLAAPAEIIRAARAYAAEKAGAKPEFIKYPQGWLNAGRWGDYSPTEPTAPMQGHYAKFTSPEREAWDAYGKATRGKTYPSDRQGGWWFPSRWPPGEANHG